jgi:proton glutamate symport protein
MMKKILKHPLIILCGVAIGVLIGIFNAPLSAILEIDNFAKVVAFPGQLYLFFLQMTVIPIIITAISSSLGKLMRNKSSVGLIKKIAAVFVLCMVICALVGMAAGMFGKPGHGLSENTRSLLTNILSSKQSDAGFLEVSLGSTQTEVDISAAQPAGLGSFFISMIPPNIFHALSLGSIMAILFSSIIFGIAIGFLPDESALLLINLCTAVFQAFQKLINWSLYLLPFGLICLLAGQIASVGVQIFVAMSKFIMLYGIGTVIIFVISTIIIWIRSGIQSPFKVISVLFEPILLAFATRNSMATLPSAINCLDNELKFNTNSVNLTLPLGMTLGRFGNIFYFALAVFFIGQIYNMPFLPIHYLVILIGVIFAGTATAGASGIVTLSMLSIVLEPLSLPLEAVLVIFMAIDPIIDPFRTFLIVYVNMAATTLIAERGDGRDITSVETEIRAAENKIQRSTRAKLAGTATEEDENAFKQINEEISKLRDEKRLLVEKAMAGDQEQLSVYVRDIQNRPPLMYRQDGKLSGYEVSLINEIGQRLDKHIVFRDSSAMTPEEGARVLSEADIIAGIVVKTNNPPAGFFCSESWGTINQGGEKKSVCFMLPERRIESDQINEMIMTLKSENFLKALISSG